MLVVPGDLAHHALEVDDHRGRLANGPAIVTCGGHADIAGLQVQPGAVVDHHVQGACHMVLEVRHLAALGLRDRTRVTVHDLLERRQVLDQEGVLPGHARKVRACPHRMAVIHRFDEGAAFR
jgi:hypothetical protein